MASTTKLQLTIVSQERELVRAEVDQVSAPTTAGEVTILPSHIPLMSQLQPGELRYVVAGDEHSFVVSRGFMDVAPDGSVSVIVDVARNVRDISEEKAQAAIEAAQHALQSTEDQKERMMAEASLRMALLELRIAQKTKKSLL